VYSYTCEYYVKAVLNSPTRRWSDEIPQIPIGYTSRAATGWGYLSFTRCSSGLPATSQEKLAAKGNAEDHYEAAIWYQNKARELEAEAVRYETAASNTGPYDPKVVQHAALLNAGQQKRADAKEMQELYVTHFKKAQSLHGEAQPQ
jgi:hypothetical protein